MQDPRRLLKRAGAVVAILAFTLGYSEAFVRAFDPQPIMPRYVTGTPWGIRGNIPNAHYWHSTPEIDTEFRINSQGMRANRDYAFEKPTDVCRVALFGDSFFMGYELNYEDTFAYGLERRLKEEGVDAEVLNFSVSGFGTAEMLRSYEKFGRRFAPDVVIFQWHSTDPDDNVRSDLYRLRDGVLVETGKSYLPSIALQDRLLRWRLYRLIADNSHLYSVVRERAARNVKKMLASLKKARALQDANASTPATSDETIEDDQGVSEPTPYALNLSAALLNLSASTINEDGSGFFVVEIPRRVSRTVYRSAISDVPHDTIAGIQVISPLKAFQSIASPDSKLYFEHGQGHITPKAVDVLLTIAVEELVNSTKLNRCRRSAAPPA